MAAPGSEADIADLLAIYSESAIRWASLVLPQSWPPVDLEHDASVVRTATERHSIEIPVAGLDQAAAGACTVTNE